MLNAYACCSLNMHCFVNRKLLLQLLTFLYLLGCFILFLCDFLCVFFFQNDDIDLKFCHSQVSMMLMARELQHYFEKEYKHFFYVYLSAWF